MAMLAIIFSSSVQYDIPTIIHCLFITPRKYTLYTLVKVQPDKFRVFSLPNSLDLDHDGGRCTPLTGRCLFLLWCVP